MEYMIWASIGVLIVIIGANYVLRNKIETLESDIKLLKSELESVKQSINKK